MNLPIFLLSLFFLSTALQGQSTQWVIGAGSGGPDKCQSIATDGASNLYSTGSFTNTADFDPGASVYNLTSAGDLDVFIMKVDSFGNLLWARSLGGPGEDAGFAIAVDQQGNCYVTGSFNNTVDFDPGAGDSTITSSGQKDIFILKLDASGNFMWAGNMGGADEECGMDVTVSANGYIYMTGFFFGTCDMDPGIGTSWLISSGGADIFVVKTGINGNFQWAKKMGGNSNDVGNAIAVDAGGFVHTTGGFYDLADFDPGAGVYMMGAAGVNDVFISRLGPGGNFIWAINIGGTGSDAGNGITVDQSGNIYAVGSFENTADFDPSTISYNLTSNGGSDIFISKYSASGNMVWTRQIGGTGSETGTSLAFDEVNRIFITGNFFNVVDFDPGSATYYLTSTGNSDAFISIFDTAGYFQWAGKMGGAGFDSGYATGVSPGGKFYAGGAFTGTAFFNPSATLSLASNGNSDIYMASFNQLASGIFQTENVPGIDIYPNPAVNTVSIIIPVQHAPAGISVFDLTGKIILTANISSGNQITLNVSDFTCGTYFLTVQATGFFHTSRLVIR